MKTTQDAVKQMMDKILADNPEVAVRKQQMMLMQEAAQSVADIVAAYRVGVVPAHASAIQVRETEQAIYAACHMLLTVFLRKLDGMGDDGTQVERWVQAILDECQQYAIRRVPGLLG